MNKPFSILFAGDFYPTGRTDDAIRQGRHDAVYGNALEVLHDKDLSLVNVECPITRGGKAILKSGPNMRARPEAVETFRRGGFDIACLANNHIGDYGGKPVVETIARFKAAGIRTVGAGADLATASQTAIVRKNGRRVAFLAFAENEFSSADSRTPGAWPLDPLVNIRQIAEARAKADLVFVVCHAGNEHNPIPSPRMTKTYRAFAEAGASAVIGMHPHIPQGWECHRGVPIFYSLGNFLFDVKRSWPLWHTGYMVRLRFDAEKTTPRAEIVPYTADGETGALKLLDGDLKAKFFAFMDELSAPIADPAEIERFWHAWCLMQGPAWTNYLKGAIGPWKTSDERRGLVVARNAFLCEAHHEVLSTYYEIVRKRRTAEARAYIPRLRNLQQRHFA